MKVLALILVSAGLLPADSLHMLTLWYPAPVSIEFQTSGPYPDYSFFWAILPELQRDVTAGTLTAFSYSECAPCVPFTQYRPTGEGRSPVAPEPQAWGLALLGIAGIWLMRRLRRA